MRTDRIHPSRRTSRREFVKMAGLAAVGAGSAKGSVANVHSDEADIEAWVTCALEGTRLRLTGAELTDLRTQIRQTRASLEKIRNFNLPSAVEPASIFRAKGE